MTLLGKLAVAAVAVVLLKVLFGGTVITWEQGKTFTFAAIDAAMVAALLGPTLTAYVTSLHDRFEDEDVVHRAPGEKDAARPPPPVP